MLQQQLAVTGLTKQSEMGWRVGRWSWKIIFKECPVDILPYKKKQDFFLGE